MVVREIREPDAMVAPVRRAGAVVPEEWRDMMMRPDRRRNMFPIGAQVVVGGYGVRAWWMMEALRFHVSLSHGGGQILGDSDDFAFRCGDRGQLRDCRLPLGSARARVGA